MDVIESVSDDLVCRSEQVLAANGRLYTAISGFVARSSQIQLALAIAKAITHKTSLVAEAGTGTGKTYAYLIPSLLSGKKALISTATKTLQDQLFHKDLPELIRALGLSVHVQNLKGRANYLCRYRVDLHAEQGRFSSQQISHEVLSIREKLPQMTIGERSELPEISEDSLVWPYVTSNADNCLGSECSFHKTCFLVKARKRALEADVVVVNHHLYFADAHLKEEGFGELLPGVELVVFDEAHQILDIASNFYGKRMSTRHFRDLMDDVLREWPVLDLANQPLKKLSFKLDGIIEQFLQCLSMEDERLGWHQVCKQVSFLEAWNSLCLFMEELRACFSAEFDEEQSGLGRCKLRLDDLQHKLKLFSAEMPNHIRWLERFKKTISFQATPLDIADSLKALRNQNACSFVFTSATLTIGKSFECFTRPLGLDELETLQLASPFDFINQALLYLPRSMPDPKDKRYYESLLKQALPVINALGGRCFFLFTSHRALKIMAKYLSEQLDYPLLIQGDEAKSILLARFREYGNAVLLGTATFWEGVDVKGEALSCVIIDKLPFESPVDPVVRAKMAHLQSKGLSGFDELSLPNAILALKQGVGRLIRDLTDTGVLMIADPRLTARPYGQKVFASLPKMKKTRHLETVLEFINKLKEPMQ